MESKNQKLVKATYRFPNAMVCTFDFNDKQIPNLQGRYTPQLEGKIKERATEVTEWNGF